MRVYQVGLDTRSPSKWLSLVLAVVGAIALSRTADVELVRYTGTYSSFEYNEEGGDLVGAELRIVKVRGGYEGTFQFAEGSPGHLALIKVETQGDSIQFVVPDTSDYAGEFQGKVDAKGVRGTLKRKSGPPLELTLPRKCGYWDGE